MDYIPYNPLDDYKKQMEEMQERAGKPIEKPIRNPLLKMENLLWIT